ncbi:hypothetical protein Pmani_037599 [Petrolisthes manimaculis]|uniref:Uncharacterized protein n=1 Tax=Petrolisthes manimaculis TaxID=1843537 RepID=A0AAE1NFY2_9EUCA|nr:hypothetical protein Pmani_037599 [Petrolisthes manimaculis]
MLEFCPLVYTSLPEEQVFHKIRCLQTEWPDFQNTRGSGRSSKDGSGSHKVREVRSAQSHQRSEEQQPGSRFTKEKVILEYKRGQRKVRYYWVSNGSWTREVAEGQRSWQFQGCGRPEVVGCQSASLAAHQSGTVAANIPFQFQGFVTIDLFFGHPALHHDDSPLPHVLSYKERLENWKEGHLSSTVDPVNSESTSQGEQHTDVPDGPRGNDAAHGVYNFSSTLKLTRHKRQYRRVTSERPRPGSVKVVTEERSQRNVLGAIVPHRPGHHLHPPPAPPVPILYDLHPPPPTPVPSLYHLYVPSTTHTYLHHHLSTPSHTICMHTPPQPPISTTTTASPHSICMHSPPLILIPTTTSLHFQYHS